MMTNEREMKMVLRLNKYTTEYIALERDKEIYYRQHLRDLDRTTIVTLYQKQAYIDTVIKQICMLVGRLVRNDVDFDNEVAMMVYNEYAPSIRRGLSDLL